MNIKDLLKSTHARIVLCDRWLVMNENIFTVYERYSRKHNPVVLYEGKSEKKAIEAMQLEAPF